MINRSEIIFDPSLESLPAGPIDRVVKPLGTDENYLLRTIWMLGSNCRGKSTDCITVPASPARCAADSVFETRQNQAVGTT
jgi:hypothetical protein